MAYTPNAADPTQPADTVALATAAAEFRALKQYLADQLVAIKASIWQTGDVRVAFSPAVPAGWLRLPVVATTISRVTYPALTAWIIALGSPWGAGDGATTIGMPFIPEGYTIGNTAVAGLGTNAVGAVIAHTHTLDNRGNPTFPYGANYAASNSANQQGVVATTSSTGGAANLPAVAYTAFLIKT